MAKAISVDNLVSETRSVSETKLSASTAIFSRVFGIDLRTLAFFRMALALLVLADLTVRLPDITAFYTEQGTLPLEAARRLADRTDWVILSPYMWVESAFAVGVLFLLTALAAIGMLAGWRTRAMTFIVWFLLCGLHMRNPLLLHSGDTLTRLLLFWSLFLPLGARWSLDGTAAKRAAAGIVTPERILSVASIAMLLQVAFVYWFTAILKTGPEWRTEFSALYYALSIEQYQTPLGIWLLNLKWPLAPLTAVTVAWEIIGPILAFLPFATDKLRIGVVIGFWFFHLIGIGLLMDIGAFPWICAAAWSVFLPGLVWDKLAAFWARLPQNAVKKDVEAVRDKIIAGRNRGIATDLERGGRIPRLRPSLLNQTAAAAFLTLVFVWNVRTTDFKGYVPQWIPYVPASVQWVTRLDQSWNMFSPMPMKEDGWFIIPATTDSGRQIDLFRGGAPLEWRKPNDIAATYPNSRWCKYMMNLWGRNNEPYRIYLCRYLMWEWNKNNYQDGVGSVQLYYMENDIRPRYAARVIVPQKLCDFDGRMPVEKIITKEMTVEASAKP